MQMGAPIIWIRTKNRILRYSRNGREWWVEYRRKKKFTRKLGCQPLLLLTRRQQNNSWSKSDVGKEGIKDKRLYTDISSILWTYRVFFPSRMVNSAYKYIDGIQTCPITMFTPEINVALCVNYTSKKKE